MSAMFDYITGKKQGTEAQLTASLEHALGLLGVEVEEGAKLRAAFLRKLQNENNCEKTGKPCREWAKCGCYLEMRHLANERGHK